MTADETALRRALFQELVAVQAGLLGIIGAGGHPRPMVHLAVPGGDALWFLAEADGDLTAEVGTGAEARYLLTGHRHDLFASITGPIWPVSDRQGLETVWSPAAEAIFPGGLGDLDWLPLRMRMAEAMVWTSPRSAVVAGMDLILSAASAGMAMPQSGAATEGPAPPASRPVMEKGVTLRFDRA